MPTFIRSKHDILGGGTEASAGYIVITRSDIQTPKTVVGNRKSIVQESRYANKAQISIGYFRLRSAVQSALDDRMSSGQRSGMPSSKSCQFYLEKPSILVGLTNIPLRLQLPFRTLQLTTYGPVLTALRFQDPRLIR